MASRIELFVGHSDTKEVADVVAKHYDGATVIPSVGLWKGETEQSSSVLVWVEEDFATAFRKAKAAAGDLAAAFDQEAVAMGILTTHQGQPAYAEFALVDRKGEVVS